MKKGWFRNDLHPAPDPHGTVREPAERPSSNLGVCGFESHPCYSERH